MPYKNKCKSIIPLLWDYESGKLTEDEQQLVDAHLHECASCREQAAQYGGVSRMVAEDRELPVPEFSSTWSRIEKQIAPPSRLRFQPGIVALWASSLLVLFIAVFGLQSLYVPQRNTALSKAPDSQVWEMETNITKEQPVNIIKTSPAKTDSIKKPIRNAPKIKRIRPRRSIPVNSLVAKQIQPKVMPDVKPEVVAEPESERYARVVAWGTNPDGTQYQSACTVYEDPETGERRVETTDRSGPDAESSLLMVSTTGL